MISINQRASVIAHQMADESEALGLDVIILSNGSTVIDAWKLVAYLLKPAWVVSVR